MTCCKIKFKKHFLYDFSDLYGYYLLFKDDIFICSTREGAFTKKKGLETEIPPKCC